MKFSVYIACPSVFYMGMGLRLVALRAARAPALQNLQPKSFTSIERTSSRVQHCDKTRRAFDKTKEISGLFFNVFSLAPSTLIRFKTKTELFCSGYGYRPHYNAENALQSGAIWKRRFWKRWFLVWTEKMMLSENGDVIKIDTTGRQTTRPRVSKMADWRYHVVSISHQFRRPICYLSMCTEITKSFSKRIQRCSVDGRKR